MKENSNNYDAKNILQILECNFILYGFLTFINPFFKKWIK